MANVLERACPLCLGVYLGSEMLEFSIEEQATKSRRTIQICGTCAGNIADAVYNHLTANEKEAKSDDSVRAGSTGVSDSIPGRDAGTSVVVVRDPTGDRGSGVDSGEPGAATGGEGASRPPESAAPAERVEPSTVADK